MKQLIVVLTFFTSGLFGQDNPMFDSLDYFERNKIITIHGEANSWWYANIFKSWDISFDKNKRTRTYHSFIPRYTDNQMALAMSSAEPTPWNFKFRDTIFWAQHGNANTERKYFYDTKKRLQKELVIDNNVPAISQNGFRYGKNDTVILEGKPNTLSKHITSTTYYYWDTVSPKIKKIVTESPNFIREANFYYEKFLLSMKTELDSNKITNDIEFEMTRYEYYPDRKLKKEIRRVASENCPGIAGRTICEGVIEYKYDTEFPKDSTPIKGIPYEPLITIKNKRNIELYAYLWAYPDKTNRDQNSARFENYIMPDSTYEIAWDPRPDRKDIVQIKKNWSPIIKKEKYTGFDIIIYANPGKDRPFYPEKAEIIFTEKVTIESLFKKPKTITIKDK